jgi:hypothetical protein
MVMHKKFRILTETEKAVRTIKSWEMTPVKLQCTFGGDASEWGRILKGQHEAHGEYLAICREINTRGYKATITWPAAKMKYGKRTRKGTIVPRTRNVLNDFDWFLLERAIDTKIKNMNFEDSYDAYLYYENADLNLGDLSPFESYEEEKSVERDFLESLNA